MGMSQLRHELLSSSHQYATQQRSVIVRLQTACLIEAEISCKEYLLLLFKPLPAPDGVHCQLGARLSKAEFVQESA
jgi:hypothetical protein